MASLTVGSFNQQGIINSFDRQGFTLDKAGSELIANSYDAHATNIIFTISKDYIYIHDDGRGMVEKGKKHSVEHMMDIYRENHTEDKSMGTSGVGAKPSLWQLSKDTASSGPRNMMMFTRAYEDESQLLRVHIPFEDIKRTGIYIGSIQISNANKEEINEFEQARKEYGLSCESGTSFVFPYSEKFHTLLENQFGKQDTSSFQTQWRVIFGMTKLNIQFHDKTRNSPIRTLELYNYNGGKKQDYYRKDVYLIHKFGERFVCENPKDASKFVEFKSKTNTCSTTVDIVDVDPRAIDASDTFEFVCSMRMDTENIFNYEKPKMPNSSSQFIHSFDKEYFNKKMKGNTDGLDNEFTSYYAMYRNNQRIVSIKPERATNNSRGNWESYFKIEHVRCSIVFETTSSQENRKDILFGIQQNKNQHSGELPKQLIRLLQYLHDNTFNHIKKDFEECCRKSLPVKPKPPVKPEPYPKPPVEPKPYTKPPKSEPPVEPKPVPEPPVKSEKFVKPEPPRPPVKSISDDQLDEVKIQFSKDKYLQAAYLLTNYANREGFVSLDGQQILDLIIKHLSK